MPRRKVLGCSFPLLIVIGVVIFALVIIGILDGPLGEAMTPSIAHSFPSWMRVSQPSISLPAETIFHIGGFGVTNTIISVWISMAFLIIMALIAFRSPKLVPRGVQNFMEAILGYLYNFCESVAGEKNARKFFPLVATLFIFIITNAWLSLIPGFGSIILHEGNESIPLLRNANSDLNLPLAMAIFSFVFFVYFGFKTHKIYYLTEFFNFGPLIKGLKMLGSKPREAVMAIVFGIITVFVGFLELISQLIRLVSLTFRLFGNMMGGEILLLMITFMVPFIIADLFYGLELFFGFIQALVFSVLTLAYMTMAAAPHENEDTREP